MRFTVCIFRHGYGRPRRWDRTKSGSVEGLVLNVKILEQYFCSSFSISDDDVSDYDVDSFLVSIPSRRLRLVPKKRVVTSYRVHVPSAAMCCIARSRPCSPAGCRSEIKDGGPLLTLGNGTWCCALRCDSSRVQRYARLFPGHLEYPRKRVLATRASAVVSRRESMTVSPARLGISQYSKRENSVQYSKRENSVQYSKRENSDFANIPKRTGCD